MIRGSHCLMRKARNRPPFRTGTGGIEKLNG